jgi:hypothetical protein
LGRRSNLGINMDIKEFEQELKLINKDLSIRPNNAAQRVLDMFPDVNKLASILYCGSEVCTIPAEEIFDEKNGTYGVDLRGDGRFIAHRTRPEALQIVKEKLEQLNNKEYSDQFFGRGDYSNEALAKKDELVAEVIDEVTVEAHEVGSGMIEGPK